jgi:bacteriocin biosynthesis cyclodehydratase domain-containing protein
MNTDENCHTSPKLLILAAEKFGFEVANRVAENYTSTIMDITHGTHSSLWPHADMILLSTGLERPRVAEAIDETAYIRGIPWAAVTMHPTEINCGPVVIPGRSACYRCFDRRRRQHAPSNPEHRDVSTRKSPTGFARHHMGVAYAFVLLSVEEALGEPTQALSDASVRSFNLVSGSTNRSNVVAVDGCDRCRGRFGSRDDARLSMWDVLTKISHQPTADRIPGQLVNAGTSHE